MTRRTLVIISIALLCAAAAWVTYDGLYEAYGSGAPYYGRTVNMDKWSSPLPYVAGIDIAALLIAGLMWRWGGRRS